MKGNNIFWLVLIVTTITFLFIFSGWVYTLPKPKPGVDCKKNSDWVWDSSCLYFQEIALDKTLKDPSGLSPVLTDFNFSSGVGGSIFLPMWYRFRYVNVLTGGYSNFSSWTKTPVMSGSCCLPCINGPGQCSFQEGYNSCTYNKPTIGISSEEAQYDPKQMQPDGSFIYMNLHRYVGSSSTDTDTPADDVQDEIIGFLFPGGQIDGKSYYIWVDALDNPCLKGCSTPSWCKSQNTCSKNCNS